MPKTILNCFVLILLAIAFISCGGDDPKVPQPTTQGLVAFYAFEGNTNDKVGDYDAIPPIGTSLTYSSFGKNKKAVNFSGGNENYAVIDEPFDYEYKTVCFWFKADVITETRGMILVSDNPNKQYGLIGVAVYEELGQKYLVMNIAGNPTTTTISEGTWYHVTLVGDAKHYSYFLNGELLDEGDFDSYLSSFNGEEETVLGASRIHTLVFTGSMDNLRIYNRALTAQEIAIVSDH